MQEKHEKDAEGKFYQIEVKIDRVESKVDRIEGKLQDIVKLFAEVFE